MAPVVKNTKNGTVSYSQEDVLGDGSTGTVYEGMYTGFGRVAVKVAVKVAKRDKKTGKLLSLNADIQGGFHAKKCLGNNAVGIIDSTEDSTVVVLEYCEKGTLCDKIEHDGKDFSKKQFISFLSFLIAVLTCMEGKIVHGDIKPENILVAGESVAGESGYKLCDFSHTVLDDMNWIFGSPYCYWPGLVQEEKIYRKSSVDACAALVTVLFVIYSKFAEEDDSPFFDTIFTNKESAGGKIVSIINVQNAQKLITDLKMPKRCTEFAFLVVDMINTYHCGTVEQQQAGAHQVVELFKNFIELLSQSKRRKV